MRWGIMLGLVDGWRVGVRVWVLDVFLGAA